LRDAQYARFNSKVDNVKNPTGVQQGVAEVWLDGKRLPGPEIPLQDDGQDHQVVLGLR
jgi:hypothetical protein